MNALRCILRRIKETVAPTNRDSTRSRPGLLGLRAVCLTIVLLTLAGCPGSGIGGVQESFTLSGRPAPLSCDIFSEFPWQEFGFGADTPADVAATAVNSWGVEEDQFRFTNLYGGDLWLEWSGGHGRRDLTYNALFGVDRQLKAVEVLWTPPASVGQVIDCLGAPRSYSAYYGPSHHEAILYVDLWYPDRGLSFHQAFYTRVTPQYPVEPAFRLDGFRVAAAARPEQAFPSIHAAGQDPAGTAYDLCQIRLWPGSLEAVEADVEELRCG